MRVIGKTRSNELFGARYSAVAGVPDFSFIDVGRLYVVYGLMVHSSGLDYLICVGESGPYWLPSELFDVADAQLPAWKICLAQFCDSYEALHEQLGVVALLGYERFVEDFSHYCGVLEREDADLKNFFVRKTEMDAQYPRD